ncbi:OASL2 protein, partial [Centropus bengalensis]|nr:OASL2 protein [Centropus bengalensis]
LRTVSADKLDRWIADVLQPSPDFTRQVKETVRQMCEFLKRSCFEGNIRVLKTVKGGSAGKGTALRNNSDADVVLFLSCFSSYEDQMKDRKYILDLIKTRLRACRETLTFTAKIEEPRYKGPANTPRSLSLTIRSKNTTESIEADLLPAYDALGQVFWDVPPAPEVYVKLLDARRAPGEFCPCFTELQKNFVKRHPAKMKNLLRLVKHWYKEVRGCLASWAPTGHLPWPPLTSLSSPQMLKPQYPKADLPPKYALELLTVYAWQEGTASSESFDMARGFRTVLELLRRHQDICIYWDTYYSLQHSQIGAHVKKLLAMPRPVILDPADPTGILGQGKKWDLVAKAATQHLSLPCIRSAQPWDVQPARLVTIEVKQLVGTSLVRTVSPSIAIWQLKEEIELAWGIPRYSQSLALKDPEGCIITPRDDESLATHGIFYSTTLTLLQTKTQPMQVFVKDDKNRTTTYTVKPTDTVRQLKEQIHAQQGPPADQQRLTYDSRELEDRHTLAHYHIKPRSYIFMLLRLRGGAEP